VAAIADFLVAERRYRGWYGLMDFGDVMIAYYSDLDRWAFDDGDYAWLNTESLPDYGLWISALRAARSDWLEAGIEMSRHNRDVDVYHSGELFINARCQGHSVLTAASLRRATRGVLRRPSATSYRRQKKRRRNRHEDAGAVGPRSRSAAGSRQRPAGSAVGLLTAARRRAYPSPFSSP